MRLREGKLISEWEDEYEDAMAVLDNVTETKKDEYSFLKSSILDTIKNRYPYC